MPISRLMGKKPIEADAVRLKTLTGGMFEAGEGAVLVDGTRPLTANWDAGAFSVRAAALIADTAAGVATNVVDEFGAGSGVTIDGTLIKDQVITFFDAAVNIDGSADGQLDLNADVTVLVTAPTIQLDGDLEFQGAQSITTTAENLTLAPAGDLITNPIGDDILPAVGRGYAINIGALTRKYLTLHAAELVVETLVAQDTLATIGGRILIGPTTVLTSNLLGAATTIYVKHNQMASGDRVYMEANGKVEFMSIDSAPGGAGPYSYTVTRNLDGSGANIWAAGDAIFNTGTTGNGFIDLYSFSGVLAGSGPTIVGNVRNSATYSDWSEHWAIGNLNGLYGYGADTYGVAFGKYSGANYITIDTTNGIRFFNSSDVVEASLSGTTWTLGEAANAKVVITPTAMTMYDANGDDRVAITMGQIVVGDTTEGDYLVITSGGATLYGGGVAHLRVMSVGTFWAGDTYATERIQWDTTNGLQIFNAANAAVLKAPTSGDVEIVGTLAVTSPGEITAGSGAVSQNSDGIEIEAGATLGDIRSYKIVRSGDVLGGLYGYADTAIPLTWHYIRVQALAIANEDSYVEVDARSPADQESNAYLRAIYGANTVGIRVRGSSSYRYIALYGGWASITKGLLVGTASAASVPEDAVIMAIERSSDPGNPPEGYYKIWMSDGTGAGDDGDIMVKIQAGATVKTATLVDFSTV